LPPSLNSKGLGSKDFGYYTQEDITMLNEKLCDFKIIPKSLGSSLESLDPKDSVYTQIKILYKDIEIFSDFCFYDISTLESKGTYYKKAKQIEDVLRSSDLKDSLVTIIYKRIYTIGYLTKKLLYIYNQIPKTLSEKINHFKIFDSKDSKDLLTSEEINALREYLNPEDYKDLKDLQNYDFQWKNPCHIMFLIQHFLNEELFHVYDEYEGTNSVKTYVERSNQLLDLMRE
jgi:hypothetical protein